MKKLFLSLLAMASCAIASAQPAAGTFSIIPRVGVSLSGMPGETIGVGGADTDDRFSSRYKAGFTGGVDLDYQFMRNLSVSLGAYYTQQGCRYENNTVEYDASGNTVKGYGYSDMTTNIDYLNVPLMLHGYIGPGFALNLGVQMGFALSGKFKYTTMEYERDQDQNFVYGKREKQEIDYDKILRNVVVAIPIGVSYEFANVIIDARYNIPLSNSFKKNTDVFPKNRVFAFSAAYRFAL